MLSIIRQNKLYFSCLGLYFAIAGILVLLQEKGDLVLFLNSRHHPLLDVLFKYITYLGDGFFAVSIILFFLLFINMYEAVVLTTSVLISFCVVQFLKLHVFYEQVRPFKYFSETTPLHRAEGLEIHLYNSFPSGHSAQAFTLFLVITLFLKNKNWSPVFFSIALLVTISRIYLAQHFLIDTYFGALIASVLTMCTYLYFNTYTSLPKKERWQRGLLR